MFTSKRNGTHRAVLVALGYSQVPGIDFTETFAPMVNDVTFRIVQARMMVENLDSMLMDVEAGFLYGELDEEIYLEVPLGLNEVYPNSINEENTCFLLSKGIYGLCQATRQFVEEICSRNEQDLFLRSVQLIHVCFIMTINLEHASSSYMWIMLVIGNKTSLKN